MSCPQLVDSGVYVLGALPPAQRLAFEAHMADCAECRAEVNELAVLPGLLGRLDEPEVARVVGRLDTTAGSEPADAAPEVVSTVLNRVHRQRRIRRIAAVAGALAAACLALLGGLTLPRHTATQPRTGVVTSAAHAMTPVGAGGPISAQVSMWSVDGGTQIRLECTYQGGTYAPGYAEASSFALYVYARNGAQPQQVGTWTARPGQTLTVPAQTAWPIANVARVELRAADGTPLLTYAPA